jgi:acyl-CoA thioester hydrolase
LSLPEFSHKIRVIFGDTDAIGVVYYSNYFRYFEIGRAELMRHLGKSYVDFQALGYDLPVLKSYCEHKSFARYDDILTITANVELLSKTRVRYNYRLTNGDGKLIAEGYTEHCAIDKKGKVVAIPPAFADLIEQK